ncbi:flagellar hook-length control protein [Rhodococcus aetherivorans]|uniref:flagellar hook-length control protein n=1 Tax=Rhodococcus aetherivorans TaxID=191292 RepID=UPI001E60F16C|nr:flagellar hook-length control protein [Rhodococcus aetherivorans]UGQ43407.1 flagellar hook-length control protein [Rhodococcus aetherivorans]
MTEPTVTLADCVNAASDVLAEVEAGTLDPTTIESRAADACRALVGQVGTPADPLWDLHVDIARQVLAAGGLTASELSEWHAVQARREAAL